MEKKDLEVQVAALVASLFDEKEEAEIRKNTEVELNKAAAAVSELTTALETKNGEVTAAEEKLVASEASIQELTTKLEAAQNELEEANEKLGNTEKALEDIKKDRAAETRMAELEDAGVARSDREDQMAKVRNMSDEDFASYKDELVSIRESVVAELDKAREEADATAQAEAEAEAAEEAKKMKEKKPMDDEEEDPKKKEKMKKGKKMKEKCSDESEESEESASEESEEASEENASEEEAEDTTTPAQVSPGQAAMASLNMEFIPSEDLVAKYAKLGKAMAERFKNSKE